MICTVFAWTIPPQASFQTSISRQRSYTNYNQGLTTKGKSGSEGMPREMVRISCAASTTKITSVAVLSAGSTVGIVGEQQLQDGTSLSCETGYGSASKRACFHGVLSTTLRGSSLFNRARRVGGRVSTSTRRELHEYWSAGAYVSCSKMCERFLFQTSMADKRQHNKAVLLAAT